MKFQLCCILFLLISPLPVLRGTERNKSILKVDILLKPTSAFPGGWYKCEIKLGLWFGNAPVSGSQMFVLFLNVR